MTPSACEHCGDELSHHDADHPGLCCDCHDLSWGMSLASLNAERAGKGKPPLKPFDPCRHAFEDGQCTVCFELDRG